MPGYHVIGELLGAAGLRPREALSLEHWLDLLSLHPTSRRGFACSWRIAFRSWAPTPRQHQWRRVQGPMTGTTHVHTWSPIMVVPETTGDDGHEDEPLELEVVWSHPIDVHLARPADLGAVTEWPYLELDVWAIDELDQRHRVGSAAAALPLDRRKPLILDLPILESVATSWRENMAQKLGLMHQEDDDEGDNDRRDDASDRPDVALDPSNDVVGRHAGTVYVCLAVLTSGGGGVVGA